MLVRPIASPDQQCAYAAVAAAPLSSTGPNPGHTTSSSTAFSPSLITCDPCYISAAACTSSGSPSSSSGFLPDNEVILGQDGMCCGGGSRQIHEALLSDPQPTGEAAGASLPAAVSGSRGFRSNSISDLGPTQYYGLVVQGSHLSDADGCWLLKTTRIDTGAGVTDLCSCTHFSLTRVCAGQPLYMQLRDAWLVR